MNRAQRLLHGQTCPVCERRRRVRWFKDTGVCTYWCLRFGLAGLAPTKVEAPIFKFRGPDAPRP